MIQNWKTCFLCLGLCPFPKAGSLGFSCVFLCLGELWTTMLQVLCMEKYFKILIVLFVSFSLLASETNGVRTREKVRNSCFLSFIVSQNKTQLYDPDNTWYSRLLFSFLFQHFLCNHQIITLCLVAVKMEENEVISSSRSKKMKIFIIQDVHLFFS